MAAGQDVDPRGASGGLVGIGAVVRQHRNRPDQDRAVVEQAVCPAELEEGVGEHDHQPEHLDLEIAAGGGGDKGQVGQNGHDAFGRADQRQAAADRKNASRGEEGGPLLQPGHDAGVDHPHVAPRRRANPVLTLAVHRQGERDPTEKPPYRRRRERCPCADEKEQRDEIPDAEIERFEGHGRSKQNGGRPQTAIIGP